MQTLENLFSTLVPFVTPENGVYWQGVGLLISWSGLALLVVVLLSRKIKASGK